MSSPSMLSLLAAMGQGDDEKPSMPMRSAQAEELRRVLASLGTVHPFTRGDIVRQRARTGLVNDNIALLFWDHVDPEAPGAWLGRKMAVANGADLDFLPAVDCIVAFLGSAGSLKFQLHCTMLLEPDPGEA